MQVVKHDEYAERAQRQRSATVKLPAHRGRIFDAGGELLVENFPTCEVVVDRNVLRNIHVCVRGMAHANGLKPKAYRSLYDDEEIIQRYAERLSMVVAGVLGEPAAKKIVAMAKKDSRRVEDNLARHLDHDVAMRLEKILEQEKLSGLKFEDSMKRFYPNTRAASHVLGFVGSDGKGKAGIEREFNNLMEGTDGRRIVERDGRKREISRFRGQTIPAVDGKDVYLTLEMPLQNMVERALDKVIKKHHPEKVTAIFMDPFTGEILAMANRPDFNLETRKGNLRNFAISDRYEPGSTFKMVSFAACYDRGTTIPGDKIDCHFGVYDEGAGFPTLRDHHPYAVLSSGMVLAKSSNIGTYMMTHKLGKHSFYNYIREFGFGAPTGVALTGEVSGLVHKPNSRHWSKTSLSRVSIGYEVDVTPLQMLNALCAVANGGNLMQPQVVSKIVDSYGDPTYSFKPNKLRRVISEETADALRHDMLLVTGEEGTGQKGAVEGYPTAGKTGTARKPNKDRSKGYMEGHYVVSFMGFLPAENPRIAGIIVVDDPKGEGVSRYGGTVAAPVFKEIAEQAMKHMGVEPSVVPRRALRKKVPVAISNSPLPDAG